MKKNAYKEAKCLQETIKIISKGDDYKAFTKKMCSDLESQDAVKCFSLAISELGDLKDRLIKRKCKKLGSFFSPEWKKQNNCYVEYFNQ